MKSGLSNVEIQLGRRDEMLRLCQRLNDDRASRIIGGLLGIVLAGAFLPCWIEVIAATCFLVAEGLQPILYAWFKTRPTRLAYLSLLANALFGATVFTMVPALLWPHPDLLVKFIAMLFLVGLMLHVSMVRATHLPIGFLSGLPPMLVLAWIPLQDLLGQEVSTASLVALVGVAILIWYFVVSLVANHRAQQDLRTAQTRAETSSQAKSRFLSAMSHEMNTPLNTIKGLTQALRQGAQSEALRHQADMMEAASDKLGQLVNDALELASGTEIELTRKNITIVLRKELDRVIAETPGLDLHIEKPVPDLVRLDPTLLRTSLSHLVAVFSDRKVGLSVRAGVAPEEVPVLQIQLTATEKAKPAENGIDINQSLAIAIVQRAAKAMDGSLELHKASNRLATLSLPYDPVPDLPETETPAPSIKALVVDDIPTNRFVIKALLNSLGIETSEADSGEDALARLSEKSFDVVVLDMNMPGMDGATTFQAIRQKDATWSATPVIALTADALPEQREAYLAFGLDGYVAKPADRHLLWSEIYRALAKNPAPAQSAGTG